MLSRGSFHQMSSSRILPHSSPQTTETTTVCGLTPPPDTLLDRLRGQITLAGGLHDAIPVRAPYTGESIGTIPAGTVADLDLAVQRARTAQAEWSKRSFADRARIFLRFHDLLMERQDEVLDLIQWETGKARRHAFEEILDTAIVTRYYARQAKRLLKPRRRKGALPLLTRTRELKSPVGVVGLIVPWNYPLNLAVTDAVPALMAGNAAVHETGCAKQFHGALGGGLAAPGRSAAGSIQRGHGGGSATWAGTGRARGLHDVHRQYAHWQAGGAAGGGPVDRVLARTRRQEPHDRAGGCRRGCRGVRRHSGVLRVGRSGVRLDRADLRARIDCRRIPGQPGGAYAGAQGGSVVGLLDGNGVAHRRAADPARGGARSRRGGKRSGGGDGRPAAAGSGAAVFRAHDPDERHGTDAGLCRGDVRTGGGGVPVSQREGGGGARQCHAVRIKREHMDAQSGSRGEAGASRFGRGTST